MLLELLLILLLNGLIFYFNWKYASSSADHNYHPRIIEEIRNNNFRLLKVHPSIAYETRFIYPQLLHWLLSFFPQKHMMKIALYQVMIFNSISAFLIYYAANSYYEVASGVSVGFVVAFFYALTPFNFVGWNSKLNGISARALGVFFCHLSLFCVYVYLKTQQIEFLEVNILAGLILLMGNQFGFQFYAFSTILFALFFKKVEFLFQLPIVFAVFLLLTRKIGVNFLKGQFAHKQLYFRHLYKFIILRLRKTIYTDLVYWVWVYLKNDFKKNLPYFLYNPIVTVVLLMPFSLFFLFLTYDHFPYFSIVEKMGLVGFILFVIFSFKRTRFLGEPERYVEIAYPIMLIYCIAHLYQTVKPEYLTFFAAISVLLIMLLLRYAKDNYDSNSAKREQDQILMQEIESIAPQGLFVASNNTRLIDVLLKSKHKVLRPVLSSLTYAGRPFEDVFTPSNYRVLNPEQLLHVIRYYKFDVLVMDLGLWDKADYKNFCEQLSITERRLLDNKTEVLIYSKVKDAL